ncbi:hypothetical protein GCM10023322_55600 [Rugosimonospora acidiphila]|uniref:Transposase n=1 Tax=Rugosimonospora acidiphila TaxID=556531 RepID=A0ABP9SBD1_9ACTN
MATALQRLKAAGRGPRYTTSCPSRHGGKLRLAASECPACPGCQYVDVAVVRDGLEAVVRLLPSPARAEMRRLLTRLDRDFRRRTLPDSSPEARWNGEPLPWWHRRIHRN